MTTRVRTIAVCPTCGETTEDTQGSWKCACQYDAEWEAYVEACRVRVCIPCAHGDHEGCDPEFCDCIHFVEPQLPAIGGQK